jgi:hypothetical protein
MGNKVVKHSGVMEAVKTFEALPGEMLERVFRLLPPRDLMAVVLVCRRWREVGEVPGLWAWVRLTVNKGNLGSMPRVLGCGRLQAVRRLVVMAVSAKLLKAVARHPGLKVVSIHTNLARVAPWPFEWPFPRGAMEPDLLARAVTRLEELDMEHGIWT